MTRRLLSLARNFASQSVREISGPGKVSGAPRLVEFQTSEQQRAAMLGALLLKFNLIPWRPSR